MPEIMTEAFAKGLLEKIMVDVLDVIDHGAQDEKSWEQHVDEKTGDNQSEFVNVRSQAHEYTHRNYSKADEIELIAKIVCGLRDIQIGDSCNVLPPSLSPLEKQVKCITCNVDGVSLANPAIDVTETQPNIQGQGDMHQIVHATILESPTELVKTTRKEKEGEAASEATSVSASLLHQLIEELESKTVSVCSKDDIPVESISKERVAIWEEKEEQFIRTIDRNAANVHANTIETLRGSESTRHLRIVNLQNNEELRSRSSQHVASTSREVDLEKTQIEKHDSSLLSLSKPLYDEEAMTMEQILPVDDIQKRKTFGETTTKKKKKGFGNRLRKLFHAAFGRRKN